MAYENLCMYCFEDLGGHSTCPHCGRDAHAAVPQIQMLPGSLVYHDRFLIGRAIGQDATGIVYAAFDTKRENKMRIREYLPRDCAERLNDGTVVPLAGMEDKYDAGIRKLRASVDSPEDPHRRHFFFEENGTAYIVQRKSSAAPTPAEESGRRDRDEDDGHKGRTAIIALIAAIVVIGAAVVLYLIFGDKLNPTKDITESPTLEPGQIWLPSENPTVTPYASPTFAALVDPELSWMDFTYSEDTGSTGSGNNNAGSGTSTKKATATPAPTKVPTVKGDASEYSNVSSKSSTADVTKLQKRLASLGWLDRDDISGSYDAQTRQAVRDFQRYVNANYAPAQRLAVDGVAGPKTQQWLYQINAVRPTPTPKPTPTPRPRVTVQPDDDTVVDANSSEKKIRAMQRELILLGVMPEGSDNGRFDTTTRSAVRRFQNRVNELQGYEVLEVSGRMDALSMAFLDYYVDEWREIQTATATPAANVTATPAPTQTPTAKPTAYDSDRDPNTVNAKSSAEAIRDVQRSLIAIGMLPEGADDGVYGETTARAISTFQQWVNQRRNEQTLPMNGEADPLTRSYLKYCQQNGMRPSAEVTQLPTAEPTTEPVQTAEPTAEPNEDEEFTIDRSSDRASIRRVQELLADAGLLSRRGIDGVYGNGTSNAVRAFQEYVNAHGGELEVTGIVDPATRQTLEYYSDHGMTVNDPEETVAPEIVEETAAPEITEAPDAGSAPEETDAADYQENEVGESNDISVGGDSQAESIRFVQQMLVSVGAMSEEDISGAFDSNTTNAVVAFQNWVNRQGMMTLEVTGAVDNGTRQMLEYYSDRGLRMSPADLDPESEGGETADPFDQATQPGEDPEVSAERASVENVSIDIAGASVTGDVAEVGGDSFVVSWSAQGDVDSYYVYVSDSAGNALISAEATDKTSFRVDATRMEVGEVYTVTVGALPRGGDEEDILWRTARFTRPTAPEPEVTEAPTPEPLPTIGTVSTPEISISGSQENGVTLISGNSFHIQWGAEGDVIGYNVQITDSDGAMIASQAGIQQTELSVRSSQLTPGMVYTIAVGAIPVNGGGDDITWTQARFMLPIEETPEPTEAPTPEPTEAPTPEPVVAEIGKPFVNVGGAGYQQDGIQYMTENTIIISWGAEGDVDRYMVRVENQNGESRSLDTTTDTSRTLSAGSLPAGVYTVYVGAIPENGDEDDAVWGSARFGIPAPAAEPTEEPEPEPEDDGPEETAQSYNYPIDADSDSDTIQALQMRLYRLGVLGGEPEQGVLDRVTLEAVADFQSRANEEYDAGLPVIDPGDPDAVVDVNTLSWISRGL